MTPKTDFAILVLGGAGGKGLPCVKSTLGSEIDDGWKCPAIIFVHFEEIPAAPGNLDRSREPVKS